MTFPKALARLSLSFLACRHFAIRPIPTLLLDLAPSSSLGLRFRSQDLSSYGLYRLFGRPARLGAADGVGEEGAPGQVALKTIQIR